jgi:hypothetical protein
MDHMEDRGYVHLSRDGSTFAFHPVQDRASVNLRWLAAVIRAYDAQDKRLTEAKDEHDGRAQLEILRPLVQQIDDERVARFERGSSGSAR